MATLQPGTAIELEPAEAQRIRFQPPPGAALYVAVHPGALKAGARNLLTLVVGVAAGSLVWVGAVDELMLQPVARPPVMSRVALRSRLLIGSALWTVVRPGLLTKPGVPAPLLTLYDRDRPWVVLGELEDGALLASPLNDATGNPKWWTPVLTPLQLGFAGAKLSQIELAHLWSLPGPGVVVGKLAAGGDTAVSLAVQRYF